MRNNLKYPVREIDTGFDKVKMLSKFISITAGSCVCFIAITYLIGFEIGSIALSITFFSFLITLILFKKGTISYSIAANLFLGSCLFGAMLFCSFFSGGIYSFAFPWFIFIPNISLLLLGISRSTLIWLIITVFFILGYGIAAQIGFKFPVEYDHEKWDTFFSSICVLGLLSNFYIITYIYESHKKRALSLLAEKNLEITDSIQYAKTIQQIFLGPMDLIDRKLPENFVLYKPKDIVSGDFYWVHESDDYFFLAVCDCTGHGVPGAFMSLLITSFLNEAVAEKKIDSPDKILDYLRERILENTIKNLSHDGMDGIILRIDRKYGRILYASGNGNAAIVSDGVIEKLQNDKMPVGLGMKHTNFSLFETYMERGDMMYLFTDGFPDLFGGSLGKKFTTKRLCDLFVAIASDPIELQKEQLDQTFVKWKGNLEQVDDICIVGFRF